MKSIDHNDVINQLISGMYFALFVAVLAIIGLKCFVE